jgi:Zn-dependent M28 family amino/carboxypeptidase
MQKFFLNLAIVALLVGCQPKEKTSTVEETTLRNSIRTLASDDFQGRKPFTEGEKKTLAFLESEFKRFGLEPGNGNSYFQEVPMVELDARPSETMTISGGKNEVTLKYLQDFVVGSERVVDLNALENSELIFAGYGVVAPEYNWNDYEGLDVTGKTVVVMVNDPGFASKDPAFFKGETMTYYGRWTYKFEEAARQGAAGCLIIHETVPAGYPWMVVQNSWSGASLYLDEAGDKYKLAVQGWITRDAFIEIIKTSIADLSNYSERARTPGFKSIPLGVSVSVSVENGIKRDKSQNVIAKITGTERPDEVIIYSAHWDHLGIGPEVDGDNIYNGAHDNASGTSGLLAIAEAFSKSSKPKRTVVFLAVTAEEQGLLGSKYYANNPIFPVKKSVANINMDGLPYYGKMKDLTVVGYGQSEMDDLAEEFATQHSRYIKPDPNPGKGYFFRSDHFHFARVGIPPLYASGSYEHWDADKGVEYIKEKTQEYLAKAYHQPADEYDENWDLAGMVQDAEVFYQIGWKLANSDLWPKWKEGSEFKSIREKE